MATLGTEESGCYEEEVVVVEKFKYGLLVCRGCMCTHRSIKIWSIQVDLATIDKNKYSVHNLHIRLS